MGILKGTSLHHEESDKDVLFLHIFIMCVELLLCLINKMIDQGIYKGIRINRYAPKIPQLMFVDDILLFERTNLQDAEKLKLTLESHAKWSGQKMNYTKLSLIFSKNVSEERKSYILNFFGI